MKNKDMIDEEPENKFTLESKAKEETPLIFDFIIAKSKNSRNTKKINKAVFKRINVKSISNFSDANYAIIFYKPISRISK